MARAAIIAALCLLSAPSGTTPISRVQGADRPSKIPGFWHPTHGYLQVALCGNKSTTLRVIAPPGWKCPPHNHPGPAYEVVTVVVRGTLTLVQRLPSGLLKRRSFRAGTAFIWPMGPKDFYGFENCGRTTLEFYMVYVPAFPDVRNPSDGLAWIQAGCPATGPPPGFKPRTDPYPRK